MRGTATIAAAAVFVAASASAKEPSVSGTAGHVAQAPATAIDGIRAFDIPTQSLGTAITAFGRQAGIQVTVDASISRGVQTQGVAGTMTASQAINQLLAGTGIVAQFTSDRDVVLTKPQSGQLPPGVMQLDPVQVQGYPVPPQATIDNLPPAYAGGLVGTGSQLGVLGNRSVMDAPFSQTSYTSKLMQDQQAKTIGEVAANDPSVRIGNQASGGVEDFIIRGFRVASNDILFAGLAGVSPSMGNSSMMTEGLERVEVLKGASGVLNGAAPGGSIGGVINVIPKRAGREPITQFTPTYTTSSQFGGHGDFGRRFGDNDEFGIRINAVYRDGATPIDLQTSQQARLFTLGADYRGSNVRASLDFGYQYAYQQAPRRYPQAFPGVSIPAAPVNTTNFNFAWEYNTPEAFYGVVRGEVDITDNLTAFASVGGSSRSSQSIRTNPVISTGFGTLIPDVALVEATRAFSGSLEAGVRATFGTGPVHHQMTLSYSRFGQSFYRQQNLFATPASNLYNPVFAPAPPSSLMPNPGNVPKESQLDFGSVAITDTMSLWDERLQLTAGVRAQNIKAWNFNTGTVGVGQVTSSYDETATSPVVAILGKPWKNVSLYANYIQGLQQGPIAPAGTLNAGQVFPPFLAQQYEIGAKVDWGKFTTTFAAYQLTQPLAFINPQTNLFSAEGRTRNRGIEFNIFDEPFEGVRVLSGASFIEARQEATAGGLNQGNYAIGVPLLKVVLGGEWDVPLSPLQGLTLVGRLIYNTSAFVDAMNVQQVPEWAQVDLGLRYTYERTNGKPIVVRATVDNLFNASYWDSNLWGQLNLSSPRTFMLSTSFNF